MSEDTELSKVITIDDARIRDHLGEIVRGTVEETLNAMLDEEKWDSVRSVLKPPPVGNLWNLGESKNTLRKLADLRDDVSSPRPLSHL